MPQFAHFDDWNYCIEHIYKQEKQNWYYVFFIVDLFWAALLLRCIYFFVRNYYLSNNNFKNSYFSFLGKLGFYNGLFIGTYALDVLENICYLLNYYAPLTLLKNIVLFKSVGYIFCLLFFVIVIYKTKLKTLDKLDLYFKSSIIGLGLMIFIALILTTMEQGSSLIIALLDSPINLLIVIVLLYILSIIFSHYPIYLFFYFSKKSDGIWIRKRDNWLNCGIIEFVKIDKHKGSQYDQEEGKFKPYRYFFGALIYLSLIYALWFTYEKYIFSMNKIMLDISFLLVLSFFLYERVRKNEMDSSKGVSAILNNAYAFFYNLSVILILCTIGLSLVFGWHKATFWFFLATLLCKVILKFYKMNEVPTNSSSVWVEKIFNFLLKIENKISGGYSNKLILIKWSGIASLIVFMLAHIPSIGMRINPIVLILIYIHLLYGVIIILLKNYLYAISQVSTNTPKIRNTGLLILKNIGIILVILFGVKKYYNDHFNTLNHLNLIDKTNDKDLINIDDYITDYHKDDDTKYYIASWGGGLRATYFNLKLLEKLNREKGGHFFENVIAASGVSGGMVGLGTHFSAYKENEGMRQSIYDQIGNGNFASTDIAYLLGRDRMPFVRCFGGRDRSIVGITNYWNIIKPNTPFDQTTYQKYWAEGLKNKNKSYPILITNTAKTQGYYGVACTAQTNNFGEVFGGATNILDIGNKTLPYFEAISTSERFPFFSATATIKGLGHFIDGGYFENSGLQSLMNLRRYIRTIHDFANKSDSLLIIVNAKSVLLSYLMDSVHELDSISMVIKAETDYKSILNGILATEKHPKYLANYYYKNEVKDSTIKTKVYYIPYPLRYSDFTNHLGGNPDTASIHRIRELIQLNNKKIDTALNLSNKKGDIKWNYAYPTLSRMLSKPTVSYYNAILENFDW